jgi:hypothetical protein
MQGGCTKPRLPGSSAYCQESLGGSFAGVPGAATNHQSSQRRGPRRQLAMAMAVLRTAIFPLAAAGPGRNSLLRDPIIMSNRISS